MSEPAQTIEGWYALHDFRIFDWESWKHTGEAERGAIIEEWQAYSWALRQDAEARQSSYGVYSIAGHKADLLFVHFKPTLQDLIDCKTEFAKLRIADYLAAPYSYVSIVELSAYLAKPGVDPASDPRLEPRLKPALGGMPAICFYPMNKRRMLDDNWYMLPMEERVELMKSHGLIGRTYAGKVSQIITGSVGFDDWEWGVTLYANDPLEFKKLIYEMRFDEVSARYADFGPFYVGMELSDEQVQQMLNLHRKS